MIVGLDVHGVITSAPAAFRGFAKWLHDDAGAKVYIISGPPMEQVLAELHDLGFYEAVHYDKVFSIVDFLRASCVDMWQDQNGTWWADEKDWWGSKGQICAEYNVSIHIDDSERYAPFFGTHQNEVRTLAKERLMEDRKHRLWRHSR
jgi:hypothetical protein